MARVQVIDIGKVMWGWSMPLPYMDQLLEDASEHPLFLCLMMEGRIHREHPVFGDYEFFSLLKH